MKKPVTLHQAIAYFGDADRAFDYAKFLRWPDDKVTCPRCGSESNSFVKTRKLWFCNGCKKQFTVKVGTIFEDSPIGLDKWMTAVWMICNCKNGISSYELHRAIGVTQKSAWFMLHRIREAMKSGSFAKMGGSDSGPVEVDEDFCRRQDSQHAPLQAFASKYQGQPVPADSARPSLWECGTVRLGKFAPGSFPNVNRETLQNMILENIDKKSTVYTDAAQGYYKPRREGLRSRYRQPSARVCSRTGSHSRNRKLLGLLKRGLKGTYVAVEPFHLDRYVTEQVFRFNNRATKDNPLTDEDRFILAMAQAVGRRLTYTQLTGQGAD